jgi:aspartate/glutamate racemase
VTLYDPRKRSVCFRSNPLAIQISSVSIRCAGLKDTFNILRPSDPSARARATLRSHPRLGVIGGVGPAATAWLYGEVAKQCAALSPVHPQIVIENAPLDTRDELEALCRTPAAHTAIEAIFVGLRGALLRLVDADVDVVALPCNSHHVPLPRLEDEIVDSGVRLLSIPDLVGRRVSQFESVLILGTTLTASSGLYDRLETFGPKVLYPPPAQQADLDLTIAAAVRGGTPVSSTAVVNLVRSTPADAVVLACTDLDILAPPGMPGDVTCVGSLRSLANECVEFLSGEFLSSDVLVS